MDRHKETEPERTREPQYQILLDIRHQHGLTPLGLMINQVWRDDPRRLAFTFARYKFVAKMLAGRQSVLEIGCADAFCTRIVQQGVGQVTVTDFDPVFIADVKSRMDPKWPLAAHSCTTCWPGRYRDNMMLPTHLTCSNISSRIAKTNFYATRSHP